jgi:16S rRNA (cytidine1402-2'-O)-methyltransferase
LGFLPRTGRKRKDALTRIEHSPEPVVIFESPQRMAKTLAELCERIPERRATLCREITKLHEEIRPGTLAELRDREGEWRGEITLVIAEAETIASEAVDLDALQARIRASLDQGASVKTVVSELSDEVALPRRELYALVQSLRGESPERELEP